MPTRESARVQSLARMSPGRYQPLTLGVVCVFTALALRPGAAQFPAVCVQNATLPNATCCPTPPGFTEPCGGPGRGRCIPLQNTDDLRNVPEVNLLDDRFDWPTSFFEFACNCVGNFSGYMCHECWYGTTGPECNQPIRTVRKEVSSLTAEERQRFISLVQESMVVESDYMVLNTSQSMDPTVNPQFLNVSVYQYLSYLHYYVSRKTNLGNDSMCDDPSFMWPDFAHGGPAFPLWHRLFSLKWERALRTIAGDETFALPYWDWIDDGGECEVCTNDFFGAPDFTDPLGRLSPESEFSTWRIMCNPPVDGCHMCDPYADNGPIIRQPGANPRYRNLPTRADVDYALSLIFYDLDPYSVRSPNTAFRNVLEGYANAGGPSINNSSVHNLVHSFLNGTMTELATAAMDPVFLVHHTFVDKLFEIWVRRNQATARRLPLVGAQPGHNRNSFLVPFFPLESAFEFFQSSVNLGYDYDDMQIGGSDGNTGTFLTPSWIAVILEAGVILVLVVGMALIVKSRRTTTTTPTSIRSRYPKMTSATEDIGDERQPIMKTDTYVDNKSYDTYDQIR